MTEINYWLMKSEPSAYGIKDLEEEGNTIWDGIRNYQARNFMRSMKIGDQVFFYHSNCKPPGIIGFMEVIETGIVDPTQFDKSSKYYDPKSIKSNPRWDCVRLKYLFEFNKMLTLKELANKYSSEELKILQKGNRLSIIPVNKKIAKIILEDVGKSI